MTQRYFFSWQEDERVILDEVGIECSGLDAARMEAERALRERAADYDLAGDGSHIAISVTDAAGREVFVAVLTVETRAITFQMPDA
jgi:hypothetical protein